MISIDEVRSHPEQWVNTSFVRSEADRRCKEIDMNKTVDEVIDSMKNEDFDRFTRSVIDSVHKKQGYDGQTPQLA